MTPSILLCDDDPAILDVVGSLLVERGYDVVAAASGEEALAAATRECPDAILLDLILPGMTGWETADALRQQPETAAVPIVIFSILAPDADEVERAASAQIVDWVHKPLGHVPLFTALKNALHAPAPPRVLVVEDDLDLAPVLTRMVEERGVEVFHAITGEAAVELSELVMPHLVVLDISLPGMDGFGVVEELRRREGLRDVALVVYTSRDLDEADRERLRLGETHFLLKGHTGPVELQARIDALLKRDA